jgi:hypothetical protein
LFAVAGRVTTAPAAGVLCALVLLNPPAARAQAGVPSEREATVSVTYQRLDFGGHFNTDGSRAENVIPSIGHLAIADIEYGLTNRLALNVRLPYVSSKFTGDPNDPALLELHEILETLCPLTPRCHEFTSLDTGAYYSTAQDYGLMLRYKVLERGLAVTPFVAATIPSHDYQTVGEAAPGQNRRALHTGFNVGRFLDPLLPRAYIQARYMYSFVDPIYGISLDRSNADFEIGYKLVPRLSVRALAAWQQTHGGLSWTEIYDAVFDADGNVRDDVRPDDILIMLDHDRLLANRYWHLGGGGTFVLTNSLSLDGALVSFVSGADSHYGVGLSIGLTWRILTTAPARPSIGAQSPFRAR